MFEGFLMAGLELHNFSVHKYGYIRDDFSCVQPALVPRVSPVWAASHKRKSLGLLGSSFFKEWMLFLQSNGQCQSTE